MLNDEITAIKESILQTVGEDCEKIILFGSYAYGLPREDSDYDVFVVVIEVRNKLPTIERTIAQKGLILFSNIACL